MYIKKINKMYLPAKSKAALTVFLKKFLRTDNLDFNDKIMYSIIYLNSLIFTK